MEYGEEAIEEEVEGREESKQEEKTIHSQKKNMVIAW